MTADHETIAKLASQVQAMQAKLELSRSKPQIAAGNK